ncbi:hypothetical protein OHV13_31900 [Kitasatospora purpeofusca]|uniref:hypothetical protein n=1 Tax=Kitasatospora purpeofusca TaxID=67352 RepID=UPI0032541114
MPLRVQPARVSPGQGVITAIALPKREMAQWPVSGISALLGHRPIEPDLPERLADTVLDGLRGRA